MASNSDNNVPATGSADSGGNKRPKLEVSSVDTNSGPRTAASASEAFGGANPFDVSAIPSSLNDPSLKEFAEQLAQSRNSDNNVPASEVAQSVSWLDLPRDVTMRILMKLSTVEILKSAQFVCKFWYLLCKDPAMWRIIDAVNIGGRMLDCYEVMIFDAIDRSAGGLQEFNIEYLGSDNVLPYLAERWLPHDNRAKDLKCLRLRDCSIEEDNMIEAVKKLPLLEEVELSCRVFSGKAVKAIGCSCPQLKSFKLNDVSFDEESLAIAESMPNLCHLELIGSYVTNEGLQAILDGCPNLVSLDLRACSRINLSGSLGKRYAERIKNLRLPNEATTSTTYFEGVSYDIQSLLDYEGHEFDYEELFDDIINDLNSNR